MRKLLLTFIIVFTTITSCKVVLSLSQLQLKKAKVYSYTYKGKDLKYIPMHHLGKKEFYNDVKEKIAELKYDGYVVFYEQISTNLAIDSLKKDTIRRKVRKIKGFNGNYDDVAKGTFLEKYVMQPPYEEMGITDNDVRADIDYLQFVNEWERVNGMIILDSTDLYTPFDSTFRKGRFYSSKDFNKIVIEYRNQYLVEMIDSSHCDKILIIYGMGHKKDLQARLRKRNRHSH